MSNPSSGGSQPPTTAPQTRTNAIQMLFHLGKTVRLGGALLADRRISIFRKLFFIISVGILMLALLGSDALSEFITSFILPVFGSVLGLPEVVGLDWVAVAVAAYNLIKVFPPEIVAEHYDRLFRTPRPVSPTAGQPSLPRPR